MKKIIITQNIVFDHLNKIYKDQSDPRLLTLFQKMNYQPIFVSNFYKKIEYYIKELKVSGVVFSGGADIGVYPIRDKFEYKLFKLCLKKKIPILGICRGMQLINKFYKGKLISIKNHVKKKIQVQDIVSKKKIQVMCYHNLTIDKKSLPNKLLITHKSLKDDSIEGFKNKDLPIYGIMWHPERLKKISIYEKKFLSRIFK